MQKDKLDHLIYSMALTLLLALFVHPNAAALIAIFIGALKELVWDGAMKRGTPDPMDALSDGVGIVLALISIDLSTWIKP